MTANPFGNPLQKALYRYRVAKLFGLPLSKCIKAFFSFRNFKKEGNVRNGSCL